ncbi:MAG: DedA family protein [bacterium]
MEFFEFLNPGNIINHGGLIILLIIVFLESGVFFGFLLPGDSLLFTVGLLSASGFIPGSFIIFLLLIIISSFLGSLLGYLTGYKLSGMLKNKEKWYFKKKYINAAHVFYNKHGKKAFMFNRFLPIVRTFVPILSGFLKISPREFIVFNIIGSILWATIFTVSGYFLATVFPNLLHSIELLLLSFFILMGIPLVLSYLRRRKKKKENHLQVSKMDHNLYSRNAS